MVCFPFGLRVLRFWCRLDGFVGLVGCGSGFSPNWCWPIKWNRKSAPTTIIASQLVPCNANQYNTIRRVCRDSIAPQRVVVHLVRDWCDRMWSKKALARKLMMGHRIVRCSNRINISISNHHRRTEKLNIDREIHPHHALLHSLINSTLECYSTHHPWNSFGFKIFTQAPF